MRGERQKAKQKLIDRYAKYYPSRKRKTSNIILFIIIIAITMYTVASFWLTYSTGVSIDSTLTTCFYTFWGTELALLAGIKVSKVIKESSDSYEYIDDSVNEESEGEENNMD